MPQTCPPPKRTKCETCRALVIGPHGLELPGSKMACPICGQVWNLIWHKVQMEPKNAK